MKHFDEYARNRAKAAASEETCAYIDALESAARAAYALWRVVPVPSKELDDLYDALAALEFFEEV